MEKAIGKKIWVIPDMYWPAITSGTRYVSHEALCVLNSASVPAQISITLLYEDREPVENLHFTCGAMRTFHIRMDQVQTAEGHSLPQGVGYAAILESDIPVVVQYTRVDTTQPELALMTTMGFAL